MELNFKIDLLELQYDAKLLLAELMSVDHPEIYYRNISKLQHKLEQTTYKYANCYEFEVIRSLIEDCLDEIKTPFHMDTQRTRKLMNLQIDATFADVQRSYLIDVQNDEVKNKSEYQYILKITLENIYPEVSSNIVDLMIQKFGDYYDKITF